MQNIKQWLLMSTLAAASASAAVASDSYVIFGGGPVPHGSQVSIEKNVIWIDEVLQGFGFEHSRVVFGSGNKSVSDVVEFAPNDPNAQRWLPLARLYNKQQEALMQYRPHNVTRSEGEFSKDNISVLFKKELSQLQAGDSLLLIYSGHGSYQPSDVSKNAFRLWGESSMDVNEFASLLAAAPREASVRYVLPQCYSGAFARSIALNPSAPNANYTARNRCGFFAVSDDKIAEGCTAGIDAGDYRDYATFFVAALAGKTRIGEPLTAQPDLNGDGKVSLNEAHAYAYTEGLSTDIPRSTSDYYLELWEPWYARWHSFVTISSNNPYLPLARRLAARLDIRAQDTIGIANAALHERQRLNATIAAADATQQADQQQAEILRQDLLQRFLREWPNADYPQSVAYAKFINEESERALIWIQQQPEYAPLAILQDRMAASTLASLQLKRQEAQYIRIQRALQLAAIKENFDRLASQTQRENYLALTACESWAPSPRSTMSQQITNKY